MAEISTFESRTGTLVCNPDQAFDFLTDIRNFRRFIPANSISNLDLEADSCSFRIDMLGNVKIFISGQMRPSKIVYSGVVPQVKNISLSVDIRENPAGKSYVQLLIMAEMNPFLKMMVTEPIKKGLEKIIEEMEKFRDWQPAT